MPSLEATMYRRRWQIWSKRTQSMNTLGPMPPPVSLALIAEAASGEGSLSRWAA